MGVGQTSLDASSGAAEGTCALGAWERPRGGSGPPGGAASCSRPLADGTPPVAGARWGWWVVASTALSTA